jgi:transposase
MRRYKQIRMKGKSLFVGIDLHVIHWHVTLRTEDVELFSGSIPGSWKALQMLLDRYPGSVLHTVYEAGYFGFWLHDLLVEYGAECVVTPPSLLPMEYGNKVKTDRRDSRKLAQLLAKGMLKRVWVPSPEERFHRQVIRRRRQLIGDPGADAKLDQGRASPVWHSDARNDEQVEQGVRGEFAPDPVP